jgi:hypothetical protein
MRVVTSITIHEVPEDKWLASKLEDRPYYTKRTDPKVEPIVITEEMIEGKRYIDGNGNEIVIGLSEYVQETLGFPLREWKDLIATLDSAISENASLSRRNHRHLKKINRLTQLVESSKPMNKYQKFIKRTGLFKPVPR